MSPPIRSDAPSLEKSRVTALLSCRLIAQPGTATAKSIQKVQDAGPTLQAYLTHEIGRSRRILRVLAFGVENIWSGFVYRLKRLLGIGVPNRTSLK